MPARVSALVRTGLLAPVSSVRSRSKKAARRTAANGRPPGPLTRERTRVGGTRVLLEGGPPGGGVTGDPIHMLRIGASSVQQLSQIHAIMMSDGSAPAERGGGGGRSR